MMNTAEWVLLVLGSTVLLLGIARAIYVAGYRKGQEREQARAMRMGAALRDLKRRDPECYETDGLTTGPERAS
jgi:hypothetical protein